MEKEKVRDEADNEVESVMDEIDKNLEKISLQIDDEIDIAKFAYRDNFSAADKLAGEVTFVPVRPPYRQSWVYISSDPAMRATVAILELKQQRETYLVKPEVALSLDGEVTNRLLVPYQDRDGALFLWAVKLTDARGNLDSWTTSALRIVHEYCDKWIKVKAVLSAGCYEVIVAPTEIAAPEWPSEGLKFLVNRAFKNRVINSTNDPVIKKLRGLM
jgi:hypothetical protein